MKARDGGELLICIRAVLLCHDLWFLYAWFLRPCGSRRGRPDQNVSCNATITNIVPPRFARLVGDFEGLLVYRIHDLGDSCWTGDCLPTPKYLTHKAMQLCRLQKARGRIRKSI